MFDINALAFLGAATSFARLHQALVNIDISQDEPLTSGIADLVCTNLILFRDEAAKVNATLTVRLADRISNRLKESPQSFTIKSIGNVLSEIESRFADQLSDMQMFCLSENESIYLQRADELIERPGFATLFPQASFEVEESAKCYLYGRYTASVFHAMRVLEYGIRALSMRLNVEDVLKPSDRKWGSILKTIASRIDELWPRNKAEGSEEAVKFRALHATLDAVKHPWRNSTMHVDTIYTPDDAIHILRCTAYFMKGLSQLVDESGKPQNQTVDLFNA